MSVEQSQVHGSAENLWWDKLDRRVRAVAPLVLAGAAGHFMAEGQWDTAWKLGVLWGLLLILNAVLSLLDKLGGVA